MREGKPSETARIVCLMRALEYAWNGAESPLKDEHARLFLTEPYKTVFRASSGTAGRFLLRPARFLYEAVVLRSVLMDQLVREHGASMPVIILGGGFDARGLRLREYIKRGLHEFDFPATQEFKLDLLKKNGIPSDYASFHQADFARKPLQEILAPLHMAGRPALIIWEGVSMYLEEQVVMETIRVLGKYFGPGTILVADIWNNMLDAVPFSNGPTRFFFETFFAEPLLYGTSPSRFKTAVADLGPEECDVHTIGELKEQYYRGKKFPGPRLPDPLFVSVMKY